MSEREFGEHYVDYLLGVLGEKDSARLRRHLEQCAECRRNLVELEQALKDLSSSLSPHPPPPGLRGRILRSLAGKFEPRQKYGPALAWWRAWAVCASALALAGGLTSWLLFENVRERDLRIAALQSEGQRLRESSQQLTLRVRDLTAPGVQVLLLKPQSNFGEVSGQVFIRPNRRRAIVFLHGLPVSEPDRAYQLWILEGGRPPHPSTVFRSEGGDAEINVSLPAAAQGIAAVAVSIEPRQGSSQPTGPIVASGNLDSSA